MIDKKIYGICLLCIVLCGILWYMSSDIVNEDLYGVSSYSSPYENIIGKEGNGAWYTDATLDQGVSGDVSLRMSRLDSHSSLFRHRGGSFATSYSYGTQAYGAQAGARNPHYSSGASGYGPSPSNGQGMTMHTTSSAEFRSFGGGGNGDGIGNAGGAAVHSAAARSEQAIYAGGLYTTSGSVPTLAYNSATSVFAGGTTGGNPVDMMAGSMSSSSEQASQQASLIASNYGNPVHELWNNAFLSSSTYSAGTIMRAAPTVGDYWYYYNAWLNSLVGNTEKGWLYDGDGGMAYFDKTGLENAFNDFIEFLENQGVTPDLGGWETSWDAFWSWFSQYGEEGSYENDHMNEWYRLPLPDGMWMLCILAVGYALRIYLRKKKETA